MISKTAVTAKIRDKSKIGIKEYAETEESAKRLITDLNNDGLALVLTDEPGEPPQDLYGKAITLKLEIISS